MLLTDNFRLVSRQSESLRNPPYTNLGNALIALGRNAGGVAYMIGHDGTHMDQGQLFWSPLRAQPCRPATLNDTTTVSQASLLVYDVNNG